MAVVSFSLSVAIFPLRFLPWQASPRVQVDKDCVVRLGEKLQKEDPTPEIFDDIQRNV